MGLSQMKMINRHVGLPLYPAGTRPKGEGIVLTSFLLMGALSFQEDVLLEEQIVRLPRGGDGRGVSRSDDKRS